MSDGDGEKCASRGVIGDSESVISRGVLMDGVGGDILGGVEWSWLIEHVFNV